MQGFKLREFAQYHTVDLKTDPRLHPVMRLLGCLAPNEGGGARERVLRACAPRAAVYCVPKSDVCLHARAHCRINWCGPAGLSLQQ